MSDVRDSVDAVLGAEGRVAQVLGDEYEPRDEQLRMARAVDAAMGARGHLLVEAGTGVGKSFAYLAPALSTAREKGERVVIATNTIALQEQLLDKDAPLLRRAMDLGPDDLRIVLVKGRGNYLSIRRLQLASRRQEKLFPDADSLASLHIIEDWAYETADGTLATLPQLPRPGVWDRAQSDSGNCMGRRCPTYEACFYQQARRAMERADVLVCNHALFFSDLALRSDNVGFLPSYAHVILDEAHMVEEIASEHFGVSLASGRVAHLLGMLYNERAHKGFLADLVLEDGDNKPVDEAIRLVMDARAAADSFFDDLAALTPGMGAASKRIREAGVVDNPITSAFKSLGLRLKRLKEQCAREEDRFELNSYAERAQMIAVQAELLVDQEASGSAYWVEVTGAARQRRVTLACSPIEVAPILRERLFESEASVILTSATLTTGQASFDHAIARLGAEGAETLALGSPFDHATQVELHVDGAMPDPRSPAHGAALNERILEHLDATDGGAFVLFTSVIAMNAAARRLESALAEREMPLWVQGRDGPRGEVLRGFLADRRSVLMGVASFWQGVDVRGEALRNVIITRLPFEPPDRPLTEARLEAIRERGGDAFREDTLPRALIRFKQGFGRLIRSHADRGRVVVLDSRICTKPYGRLFLRALPEGVRVIHRDAD